MLNSAIRKGPPRSGATVIYLRERSIHMLKNDLILRNPLRLIGKDQEQTLAEGEFGAILARAGVGKTSFLVQLALDSLLRHRNVLHISLDQPVRKVCLWYEEVFYNIARQYDIKNTSELWETILPHRFVMTFNVEGFTVGRLEERLNDLTEQGIFFPQMVMIDGLPFNDSVREPLSELKLVAKEQGFPVWFAVKVQSDEDVESGIPQTIAGVEDLFETMIGLKSDGQQINVNLVKGPAEAGRLSLVLDPATLLIKDRG